MSPKFSIGYPIRFDIDKPSDMGEKQLLNVVQQQNDKLKTDMDANATQALEKIRTQLDELANATALLRLSVGQTIIMPSYITGPYGDAGSGAIAGLHDYIKYVELSSSNAFNGSKIKAISTEFGYDTETGLNVLKNNLLEGGKGAGMTAPLSTGLVYKAMYGEFDALVMNIGYGTWANADGNSPLNKNIYSFGPTYADEALATIQAFEERNGGSVKDLNVFYAQHGSVDGNDIDHFWKKFSQSVTTYTFDGNGRAYAISNNTPVYDSTLARGSTGMISKDENGNDLRFDFSINSDGDFVAFNSGGEKIENYACPELMKPYQVHPGDDMEEGMHLKIAQLEHPGTDVTGLDALLGKNPSIVNGYVVRGWGPMEKALGDLSTKHQIQSKTFLQWWSHSNPEDNIEGDLNGITITRFCGKYNRGPDKDENEPMDLVDKILSKLYGHPVNPQYPLGIQEKINGWYKQNVSADNSDSPYRHLTEISDRDAVLANSSTYTIGIACGYIYHKVIEACQEKFGLYEAGDVPRIFSKAEIKEVLDGGGGFSLSEETLTADGAQNLLHPIAMSANNHSGCHNVFMYQMDADNNGKRYHSVSGKWDKYSWVVDGELSLMVQ